jgi:hypothetical protein
MENLESGSFVSKYKAEIVFGVIFVVGMIPLFFVIKDLWVQL